MEELDPIAQELIGPDYTPTASAQTQPGAQWGEPIAEPTRTAPDVARFIPRTGLWEAQKSDEADAWITTQREQLAQRWYDVQAQALDDRAAEIESQQEPALTGDADRGIGQPGRMPETISGPRQDRRTGNLGADLFNMNIGDPIRNIMANAGPEGGEGAALESAGVLAAALPFGAPGKAPAVTRALEEASSPALRGAIEAFNKAPVKEATGLMDWAKATGRKIETAVADRFAAMNAIGPETEAAKSAYLGRAPAATQRVMQDLGEAVRTAGDDLPELNAYVGLQRYIETADLKGKPGPATSELSDEYSRLARLLDATATEVGQGKWGRNRNEAMGEALDAIHELHPDMPSEVRRALNAGGIKGLRAAAKEAKALTGRAGAGGLRSAAEAQAQIAELEASVGPERWEQILAADDLRSAAMRKLLDDKVAAGLVSPDVAAKLVTEQPHYNPTVLQEYLDQVEASGGKLQQNWNTLRRLSVEGHEGDQLPPLQAAMKAIYEGDTNIRRNNLIQTMVKEGGFEARLAREREFASGPLVGMKEETAQGNTMVRGALKDEGAATIVRYKNQNQPKPGEVSFWRDGKHYVAEVPDDIAKAANNMTTDQMQGWEKAVSSINQTLRLGATAYNPAFLATNAVADTVQAFLIEGVHPGQLVKGYVDAFRKSPDYQRYIAAGGGFGAHGGLYGRGEGTAANLDDLQRQIQANGGVLLKTRGDVLRAIKDAARGGFGLEKVGAAIEQGPRIATFKKLTGQGMDDTEAAMRGRRVTVDFERAGQWVQTLNSVSPFLNARTQGTLNVARALRDRPKEVAPRLGALIAASVPVYAYNRQFPEYADVPDYIKQNSLVLMLPGSEPNPEGKPGYKKLNYVALPLREWAAFLQPVRGLMEYIDGKDPKMMDVVANTLNAASPMPGNDLGSGAAGLLPPIAKVPLEQSANYDFFRGLNIVPEREESLLPELQYGPRTTEVAKALGAQLGWSPRKIDHFIQGMAGGGGKMAAQAVSQVMGQGTDKPPVVGGLVSGVLKDQGGQIEQTAYKDRDQAMGRLREQYRPVIRAFELNLGTGSIDTPPTQLQGIALQPKEQAAFQEARLAAVLEFVDGDLDSELRGEPPDVRQKVLRDILADANKVAAAVVLDSIPDAEFDRRADLKAQPNPQRALPQGEYAPVGVR